MPESLKPASLGIAGLVCLLSLPAHADVFAGRDDFGVAVYSDRPAPGLYLLMETGDLPGDSPARRQSARAFRAGMAQHGPLIRQAAVEQGIDPALLHAVVQVESGYNAHAVSHKGAIGLMQLMPATARTLGVGNAMDPADNLRGGARHLRDLIDTFDGNLRLALAAYNAGEPAVRRYGTRIPAYPETVSYVAAVLRRYERLRRTL